MRKDLLVYYLGFVLKIAAVLVTVSFVSYVTIAGILHFDEVTSPGLVDVEGTVESNLTTPLGVVARRLEITSKPEPLALSFQQSLLWYGQGHGYLSYVYFFGSSPGRWVRIYNSTGSIMENFTASLLSISYASFGTCSAVNIWDSDYSGLLSEEGHLIELRRVSDYDSEISISPTYTDIYGSFEINAVSVRSSSRVVLVCDRLNLTADDRQLVFDNKTSLTVDTFGTIRAGLVFGSSETLRVMGATTLTMHKGNGYWTDVRIVLSAASDGISHRGSIDIIGFEEMTLTLPGQSEDDPQSGLVRVLPIEGRALRILIPGDSGSTPVAPVIQRNYSIADEGTRNFLIVFWPIVLGIVFSYIADWVRDEWKKLRSRGPTRGSERKDDSHP